MADTNFSDQSSTVSGTSIISVWLNAVNKWLFWGRRPSYATTTGSANAQVLTLETGSLYVIGSEADGDEFIFVAGFTNTTTMTLQVKSPGGTNAAQPVQTSGTALSGGEVQTGAIYKVVRLGSSWQLFPGRFTFSSFPRGTDGQLVIGQTGADSSYNTVSGDATLSKTGLITLGTNVVTNAKAAQMAADTVKVNNTGGTANATDLAMAASTMLARLASGDIVAATVAQILTLLGIGSPITNSLSGDVNLNNIANYFDGPSVAQGTVGTWFVSGTVSVWDTAGGANILCKLWDGTTLIATCAGQATAASTAVTISLSGYLTSPAGNLRISVRDSTSTSGKILFNQSGNSKDSTITAIRIA